MPINDDLFDTILNGDNVDDDGLSNYVENEIVSNFRVSEINKKYEEFDDGNDYLDQNPFIWEEGLIKGSSSVIFSPDLEHFIKNNNEEIVFEYFRSRILNVKIEMLNKIGFKCVLQDESDFGFRLIIVSDRAVFDFNIKYLIKHQNFESE